MKQAVSWTSNCKLQFHALVSTPDRLAFEHSHPDTHMDSVLRPSQPQPSQPPSELSSSHIIRELQTILSSSVSFHMKAFSFSLLDPSMIIHSATGPVFFLFLCLSADLGPASIERISPLRTIRMYPHGSRDGCERRPILLISSKREKKKSLRSARLGRWPVVGSFRPGLVGV